MSADRGLRRPCLNSGTVCALGIFTVTALVFVRTAAFPFVNYDDGQYVYENVHVASGLSLANIVWAFKALHGNVSYWHPLTWISHQTDCQLFGLRAGAHHLTNVWIHISSALALLFLLRRMRLGAGAAFWVAALFGLHPLHVESVAWISERKDVLYGFFWILALYCFIRFREAGHRGWYAGSLACFVLSLLAKPSAVTLPLVLLLVVLIRPAELKRDPTQQRMEVCLQRAPVNWLPLLPFFGLAFALGLITVFAQARLGTVESFGHLPIGDRFQNSLVAYVSYLRKAVWPEGLCASYLDRHYSALHSLAAFLILSVLSFGAWRVRGRNRWICFGWLWFVLTLLPNIGLIQVGPQSMADRYTYLPLIGLFVVIASAVESLHARPWVRPLRLTIGAFALIVCTFLSCRQLSYWNSGVALFSRVLSIEPDNWVGELGLGSALLQQNRPDAALPHFKRALLLPGNIGEAHKGMGLCLARQGDWTGARLQFRAAERVDPRLVESCGVMMEVLRRDARVPQTEPVKSPMPSAAGVQTTAGEPP